jgi:hypothetical protein
VAMKSKKIEVVKYLIGFGVDSIEITCSLFGGHFCISKSDDTHMYVPIESLDVVIETLQKCKEFADSADKAVPTGPLKMGGDE